jgi:hypothetical protein
VEKLVRECSTAAGFTRLTGKPARDKVTGELVEDQPIEGIPEPRRQNVLAKQTSKCLPETSRMHANSVPRACRRWKVNESYVRPGLAPLARFAVLRAAVQGRDTLRGSSRSSAQLRQHWHQFHELYAGSGTDCELTNGHRQRSEPLLEHCSRARGAVEPPQCRRG